MFAVMKMLGSVLVLGRITAPHIPAHHAQAQMNPRIAHLHALFTNVRIGVPNLDLIQMLAFVGHPSSPLSS
jgi:hypothetical protein